MLTVDNPGPYEQFTDDEEADDEVNTSTPGFFDGAIADLVPDEPGGGGVSPEDEARSGPHRKFSKSCLKNVFTVALVLIYVLLTAMAAFLAYQTISDFLEKLNHPVMSVTYKEVDEFAPPGIALFPGKARLLSCVHHYHASIPPLVDPGTPQPGDCTIREVTYYEPFKNATQKKALVVRGPSDVRNKEVVFMQFSHNETQEDFSAITYMLFAKYSDLTDSVNTSEFMRDCERNYSTWTFSGGFRTWVKMSLVKTSGRSDDGVEFRQESGVVKFNDRRPEPEQTNQLFFVVFEWRDPFMQEIKLIVTANPWNSGVILCGVLLALFKAANFAKLTIQWIIKIRKRSLRKKARELNQVT